MAKDAATPSKPDVDEDDKILGSGSGYDDILDKLKGKDDALYNKLKN